MAEIENTPDLISGDDIGANALDHTTVADSFINVASSDPTTANDTGLGYVVGSLWVNSTSGDVFQAIGVDAENAQWANQAGDDVNISPAWQGLSFGYETGGGNIPGSPSRTDEVSRWSLTAPYAVVDIGTLSDEMYSLGPAQAGTTCFIASGRIAPVTLRDEVASFPASAPTTISDVGNVNNSTAYAGSGWSATKGYLFSGNDGPGAGDTIQDYSLVAPYSANDVAEHGATDKEWPTSHDDDSYSYIAGGAPPGSGIAHIYRYQKGTSTPSSDIGEIVTNNYAACGNTDNTNSYGFISGGGTTPAELNEITRFPFVSPTSGADVGEHSVPFIAYGANRGVSSQTHGHTVSRTTPGNVKERFAFGSPASGADIGEVASGVDDICCHGI